MRSGVRLRQSSERRCSAVTSSQGHRNENFPQIQPGLSRPRPARSISQFSIFFISANRQASGLCRRPALRHSQLYRAGCGQSGTSGMHRGWRGAVPALSSASPARRYCLTPGYTCAVPASERRNQPLSGRASRHTPHIPCEEAQLPPDFHKDGHSQDPCSRSRRNGTRDQQDSICRFQVPL